MLLLLSPIIIYTTWWNKVRLHKKQWRGVYWLEILNIMNPAAINQFLMWVLVVWFDRVCVYCFVFFYSNPFNVNFVFVHCKEIHYLQKHIVMPVFPGKSYCVSVCFWNKLIPKVSNCSQHECADIAGLFSTGTCHALLCFFLLLLTLCVLTPFCRWWGRKSLPYFMFVFSL